MHFQRISIIISAAAGMLGTFLPWVNIPILGSYNGTQGDGWITFVLFALTVFLAIVGNKQHVLRGGHFFITMLFSVAAGGFGLWKIIDFHWKYDIRQCSDQGCRFRSLCRSRVIPDRHCWACCTRPRFCFT